MVLYNTKSVSPMITSQNKTLLVLYNTIFLSQLLFFTL